MHACYVAAHRTIQAKNIWQLLSKMMQIHRVLVKSKCIKTVACFHKAPWDKNMKRDSVSAYVHMKRDTPLPLYASVDIVNDPSPFP